MPRKDDRGAEEAVCDDKHRDTSIMQAEGSRLGLVMIRASGKAGMENAKSRGKWGCRPQTTKEDSPAVFYKHDPAFVAGTMNLTEPARVCGLSRPTVYKYLKLVD